MEKGVEGGKSPRMGMNGDVDDARSQDLWVPEARRLVRDLVGQCPGRPPTSSLYLEMQARRHTLHGVFDRTKPGRCVRGPWCALTVCFLSAGRLRSKLSSLSESWGPGRTCWLWVSREPSTLWPGSHVRATCVMLLAGVPATLSVRRVAELLLDSPLESLADQRECAPGWWVEPITDADAFQLWYSTHRRLLWDVEHASELDTGAAAQWRDSPGSESSVFSSSSSVASWPLSEISVNSLRGSRQDVR